MTLARAAIAPLGTLEGIEVRPVDVAVGNIPLDEGGLTELTPPPTDGGLVNWREETGVLVATDDKIGLVDGDVILLLLFMVTLGLEGTNEFKDVMLDADGSVMAT